ncbi:glycosyltransferase [Enterobacter ludwigii]|uniref:glycosyltransferase n=1 Tax=Enterobacter cloacae complex sp. 386G2 TaxID=3395876 RepID=UPI001C3A5DD8|nr:glycosyltransferase [Enterobacter cloacae]HEI9733509.1 glycosyltransferase [Enterobacter cloacae]
MSSEKKIISVCVVTFNSGATIVETLDSIKNQNYGTENIELIIADDCSCDDTLTLIKSWLDSNGHLFNRTQLIERKKNIGLTKNINDAWRSSKGEWIKSIAGDDILLDICLSENFNFASKYKVNSVIFSLMQSFSDDFTNISLYPSKLQRLKLHESREVQLEFLTSAGGFACAPSAFINRTMMEEVGFADERFTMLEDSPLWLRILETGAKLHFMNVVTVRYRVGNSISQSNEVLFNFGHLQQRLLVDYLLFKKYCSAVVNFRKAIFYIICIGLSLIFSTKKTKLNKLVYRLALLFKPYWLKDKLTK